MMRLARYTEIKNMLRERSKKALPTEPRGYGYGAWHQAIVDLAAEIENKDWLEKAEVIFGEWLPRNKQSTITLAAIIEMDAVHCHLTEDEFKAAVKKLMTKVKQPTSDNPELAAVEEVAEVRARDLEAANRRIAELEEANARLQSTHADAPAPPAPNA